MKQRRPSGLFPPKRRDQRCRWPVSSLLGAAMSGSWVALRCSSGRPWAAPGLLGGGGFHGSSGSARDRSGRRPNPADGPGAAAARGPAADCKFWGAPLPHRGSSPDRQRWRLARADPCLGVVDCGGLQALRVFAMNSSITATGSGLADAESVSLNVGFLLHGQCGRPPAGNLLRGVCSLVGGLRPAPSECSVLWWGLSWLQRPAGLPVHRFQGRRWLVIGTENGLSGLRSPWFPRLGKQGPSSRAGSELAPLSWQFHAGAAPQRSRATVGC